MGRASEAKYTKYGYWEGLGLGTGIAPSRTHQSHTPGTPLPTRHDHAASYDAAAGWVNMAVGLISVAQLT